MKAVESVIGCPHRIERLIADKAYDSDKLRGELAEKGIDLICPHRRNRKKKKVQDGRKLKRYKRRWKVERLFAWMQEWRRTLVRWEWYPQLYLAFATLAFIMILLRRF